jgi:DNA-binding transcriptional ArsR family regulator
VRSDVFRAVGDPTRRALVERLSRGDASVGELAAPFRMTRAAVSQHLRVLEEAGLVRTRRRGRLAVCTLRRAPLARVAAWARRASRRPVGRRSTEPHGGGEAGRERGGEA